MSDSYHRNCKYCERRIQMRKMPAGQWVAFEGYETVHDCQKPPTSKRTIESYHSLSRSETEKSRPYTDIGIPDVSIGSTPSKSVSQRTPNTASTSISKPNISQAYKPNSQNDTSLRNIVIILGVILLIVICVIIYSN